MNSLRWSDRECGDQHGHKPQCFLAMTPSSDTRNRICCTGDAHPAPTSSTTKLDDEQRPQQRSQMHARRLKNITPSIPPSLKQKYAWPFGPTISARKPFIASPSRMLRILLMSCNSTKKFEGSSQQSQEGKARQSAWQALPHLIRLQCF